VHVRHLDHVVLVVADVERSLAWYCDELGLRPERVEEWRRGAAPFPSVRVDDATIIDLLARPGQPADPGGTGNMDHLCFVVEPDDLARVVASGRFEVVDGPAPRFGARGIGTSVYVRDPDGNLVELRHYGGA
jgi:catechol 2,3-dioxygenase-like lactoylglutathione lyase family enzyme